MQTRSLSAARAPRTDRICARGAWRPVRSSDRDAWRPRTNSARLQNLALVSQRSAATISRSTVRADRGVDTHAMDPRGVVGATTSSAAPLIDVLMVLPQWSPREQRLCRILQHTCRAARRHHSRRSPQARRSTPTQWQQRTWFRLQRIGRIDDAVHHAHARSRRRVPCSGHAAAADPGAGGRTRRKQWFRAQWDSHTCQGDLWRARDAMRRLHVESSTRYPRKLNNPVRLRNATSHARDL